MTHDQLVARAVRWLKGTMRVSVAVPEAVAGSHERADAIGYTARGSTILVECKTSLADYRADRDKPVRRHPEIGMGQRRYYFTPRGLLPMASLPPKWGLAEVHGEIVRILRHAEPFEAYHWRNEIRALVSRYWSVDFGAACTSADLRRAQERLDVCRVHLGRIDRDDSSGWRHGSPYSTPLDQAEILATEEHF